MFSNGAYATIWNVITDDNDRVKVELSTSRKDRETGSYQTDFSDKYVNFVGEAKELGRTLQQKDRIRIEECGVSNRYDKEKQRMYTYYYVFKASKPGSQPRPDPEETGEEEMPY